MTSVMFIMLGVIAIMGVSAFVMGRDRTDYEAKALGKDE